MIGRIVALAAIAVFVGSGMAAAEAENELSDTAKLAQDRMAIEDTLRRYVHALDDSDLGAYLATLTDDAKFVSAEGAQATATHHVVTNQSYEVSKGYLVYNSRLWVGCQSRMFDCSTTHKGEANPSLSQIQIVRDAPSFTKYPCDVVMSVCRQCVSPLCVQNCPTGACHVDATNGRLGA